MLRHSVASGFGDEPNPSLRCLGPMTATLIVVANMIGTGVFTTTGFMVRDLHSLVAVLICWVIGGFLAVCGALSYSELVAALPRNGGEYQILSRVFHPAVGFVAAWISLVVGFSAPIAASALAFGRYLSAILPEAANRPLIYAVSLVVALSVVHALHVKTGGWLQNIFTLLKVALILFFIVGGLTRTEIARLVESGTTSAAGTVFSPPFAISLIYVSFSYSGWNGSAYIAGEVRDPARALPRALLIGTAVVVVLYLGLNLIFVTAAPRGELAGVVEVGHVAAVHLFGERAGTLLSGVISLALVSSVSAMIMAGPRVYHTVGEDHARLGFLARRTRLGAPAGAVLLQAAVTILLLLTATFEVLLTYIGFTLSLSSGLTVLGVIWFRWREGAVQRPYRAWGFPVTPSLYILLSCWIIGHAIVQRPAVALAGAATIGSGLGLYAVLARVSRPPSSP